MLKNKSNDTPILYFDMDNVLVSFQSGIDQLSEDTKAEYEGRLDEVPGIFALMVPMEGAIEAYRALNSLYDIYILSTAPWNNPSAWSDKLEWVKRYIPDNLAYKRLILTHNKHLNEGDYLVDDRTRNGADRFKGKHIHFGQPSFPDWAAVVDFLKKEREVDQD